LTKNAKDILAKSHDLFKKLVGFGHLEKFSSINEICEWGIFSPKKIIFKELLSILKDL